MESTIQPPVSPRQRPREEQREPRRSTPAPQHAGHDDWGHVEKPRNRTMIATAVAAAALLLALFAVGFIPRTRENQELNADAEAARTAPVPVSVAKPTPGPKTIDISVPGTLRPWQEVSIYARTTGYLKKWYPDISNHVKAGQLMAEIDSPEVDAQLQAAIASLAQMKAALLAAQSDEQIAQTTYVRFYALRDTNGVTQQQLDQYAATLSSDKAHVEQARANIQNAEANVKQLSDLQSFEKVIAPFPGVISSRPYDIGALILASPTDPTVLPIYKIAENDVLRVFVNVPQSSALSVQKRMTADVTAIERPGRTFTGTVMGTTNYLDPTSRSLLTEVKVPNDDEALLPGMYVYVHFKLDRPHPPLLVPGPAIIENAQGSQVAVVQDGKIHFVKVKLGEDFGSTVEVTEGLNGNEEIVATPGERIAEGVSAKALASSDDNPRAASNVKIAEAQK